MSRRMMTVSGLAIATALIAFAHPAGAQTLDKLTNKAKELAAPITGKSDDWLESVATFDHQVTGVTRFGRRPHLRELSALVRGRSSVGGRGPEGWDDQAVSER